MGITIHYKFGIWNEKALEKVLTKAKEIAEKLEMEVLDLNLNEKEKCLIILPHENSETINLVFQKWKDVKEKNLNNWDYQREVLKKVSNVWYDDENFWVCADFTKTQFAGDITHIKVAEILRYVAKFCSFVDIYDEAEYYETRDKEKLLENFGENAELINTLSNVLKKIAGEDKVITGFDMQKLNTT